MISGSTYLCRRCASRVSDQDKEGTKHVFEFQSVTQPNTCRCCQFDESLNPVKPLWYVEAKASYLRFKTASLQRLSLHTPIIPILLPTNHVKLLIELTDAPHSVFSNSNDLTTLANPKSAILMIELSALLLRSSPA